jgi:hypothetical protein
VHARQAQNPVLLLTNFRYKLTPHLAEDILVNTQSLILLSLRYHGDYPLYLKMRLQEVRERRGSEQQIIVILLKDAKDDPGLTGLSLACFDYRATLMCAWRYSVRFNAL